MVLHGRVLARRHALLFIVILVCIYFHLLLFENKVFVPWELVVIVRILRKCCIWCATFESFFAVFHGRLRWDSAGNACLASLGCEMSLGLQRHHIGDSRTVLLVAHFQIKDVLLIPVSYIYMIRKRTLDRFFNSSAFDWRKCIALINAVSVKDHESSRQIDQTFSSTDSNLQWIYILIL